MNAFRFPIWLLATGAFVTLSFPAPSEAAAPPPPKIYACMCAFNESAQCFQGGYNPQEIAPVATGGLDSPDCPLGTGWAIENTADNSGAACTFYTNDGGITQPNGTGQWKCDDSGWFTKSGLADAEALTKPLEMLFSDPSPGPAAGTAPGGIMPTMP